MSNNIDIKKVIYGYPIACPTCLDQDSSTQCDVCRGGKEILLRLGPEELVAFYQEYIVERDEAEPLCPYMSGQKENLDKRCPVSGAINLDAVSN